MAGKITGRSHSKREEDREEQYGPQHQTTESTSSVTTSGPTAEDVTNANLAAGLNADGSVPMPSQEEQDRMASGLLRDMYGRDPEAVRREREAVARRAEMARKAANWQNGLSVVTDLITASQRGNVQKREPWNAAKHNEAAQAQIDRNTADIRAAREHVKNLLDADKAEKLKLRDALLSKIGYRTGTESSTTDKDAYTNTGKTTATQSGTESNTYPVSTGGGGSGSGGGGGSSRQHTGHFRNVDGTIDRFTYTDDEAANIAQDWYANIFQHLRDVDKQKLVQYGIVEPIYEERMDEEGRKVRVATNRYTVNPNKLLQTGFSYHLPQHSEAWEQLLRSHIRDLGDYRSAPGEAIGDNLTPRTATTTTATTTTATDDNVPPSRRRR